MNLLASRTHHGFIVHHSLAQRAASGLEENSPNAVDAVPGGQPSSVDDSPPLAADGTETSADGDAPASIGGTQSPPGAEPGPSLTDEGASDPSAYTPDGIVPLTSGGTDSPAAAVAPYPSDAGPEIAGQVLQTAAQASSDPSQMNPTSAQSISQAVEAPVATSVQASVINANISPSEPILQPSATAVTNSAPSEAIASAATVTSLLSAVSSVETSSSDEVSSNSISSVSTSTSSMESSSALSSLVFSSVSAVLPVSTSMPSATSSSTFTSSSPSSTSMPSSTTSSTSSTSASVSLPPAAAVTGAPAINASATHSPPFWIGIALAAIGGLGLIIAVIAWFFRIRRRGRKREPDPEFKSDWPWDKPEGDVGLGLGITDMPSYPAPVYNGSHVDNTNAYDGSPLPPSVVSADFGTGPLKVSNLMPGDVSSSGDESSRPGTSLSMHQSSSALLYGEDQHGVQQLRSPVGPRYIGLRDGGLDMPWKARLRAGPSTNREDVASGGNNWKPLPFPGEGRVGTPVPENRATEGWTSSLRSGLVNTFGSLAGGYLASARAESSASAASGDDKFTSVPVRNRRRSSTRDSVFTRTKSSGSSLESVKEEDQSERSTNGNMEYGKQDGTQALNVTKKISSSSRKTGKRVTLAVPSPTALSRASSTYSTASIPPRLPSIPPMSRGITLGISGRSNSADAGTESSADERESHTRDGDKSLPRPKVVTRISSSNCSETSCASGSSSGSLTEGEKMVQSVLRERRRRVMSMGAGRGTVRPGSIRVGSARAKSAFTQGEMRRLM